MPETVQPRVLDLGNGVGASYAAKLLADHGADVIKVEPEGGVALRRRGVMLNDHSSGFFAALHLNKRSLVLTDTRLPDELLATSDIIVHDLGADAARRGLDADRLSRDFPGLINLSITPFGLTGPHADYAATELILSNAGGWANLCPATHTDPTLPPLKVSGEQCSLMAAIAAAMAALACWREQQRSGIGETIDFSVQEYVASVLETGIPSFSYRGQIANRFHLRRLIPWRIFMAEDAPVFIVCVEQDQWERLVAFMGNPEWAALEVFKDQPSRAENQDLVHTFVQEFVAGWRAMDLYHAAQRHRICVAPVMDLAQLADNEHLRERQFFNALDGLEFLAPAVVSRSGRAGVYRAAPEPGQHNAELNVGSEEVSPAPSETSSATGVPATGVPATGIPAPPGPLAGVRVLDLTWAWAGPFASMNLAHLGAEVIRIESEVRPDLYRRLPVFDESLAPGLNRSGMFNQWNQGKSSMAMDLSKPEAIEIVRELVAASDVIVQNFATGVMDRLGLGYDLLRTLNPGIILASISGYGQSGPYRDYMGYGPAIPPLTGLAAATGYPGGDAEEIGLSMPDPTAGITAALAVVSALVKRDSSGLGDHLDITLWEATGALNVEGWMHYVITGQQPVRAGNRDPGMAPHGVFPCEAEDTTTDPDINQDRWIAIACRDDGQWRRLAELIGPDLATDPRFTRLEGRKQHEDELEIRIADWTASRNRFALTRELQQLGIPAFPTFNTRDVVEDPHMNSRGFIEHLEHPEVGKRAHAGIPWRLQRRDSGVQSPAPCIGADTDQHLRKILGYDATRIADLRSRGVIS